MQSSLRPDWFGTLRLDGSQTWVEIFNLSVAGFTARPPPGAALAGHELVAELRSVSGIYRFSCSIRVTQMRPQSAAVLFVECDADLVMGVRRLRWDARRRHGRRIDRRGQWERARA